MILARYQQNAIDHVQVEPLIYTLSVSPKFRFSTEMDRRLTHRASQNLRYSRHQMYIEVDVTLKIMDFHFQFPRSM